MQLCVFIKLRATGSRNAIRLAGMRTSRPTSHSVVRSSVPRNKVVLYNVQITVSKFFTVSHYQQARGKTILSRSLRVGVTGGCLADS
jgi:hypothetical protein